MDKPEMTKLDPPEKSRTYHYSDGGKLTLAGVVAVCVRPSGTHRLETAGGIKWIVMPGWLAVEIDVPEWTF